MTRLGRKDLLDDRGSTLLLTIFYAALALALILMVVAATSLYLERERLFTVADGAALVGAEAYTLDDVTVTPAGPRPTLRSANVAAAVKAYLADNPIGTFEGLTVDRADSRDGHTATVVLSTYWRPPMVTLFAPEGVRMSVSSVARSVFG
jgi:uncharacterized membrane protein